MSDKTEEEKVIYGLFKQHCTIRYECSDSNIIYDDGFIGANESAQAYLIEKGIITKEQCMRHE